jgi:transposase-like protein
VGQLLHGSARTTAALRRTIQHSQESIARLAARYDLNAKTVAKWRKRTSVEDARMGPRQPHSTVLTKELDEAAGRHPAS